KAGQVSLFGAETGAEAPQLDLPNPQDWDQMERLRREFDAVGFYLSAHPLDSKVLQLEKMGVVAAAQVDEILNIRPAAVLDMAGVLLKKQIKVSPKSGNKYAFLQLSDSTGVYEVTLFSETLAAARDFLNEGETLLLKVTVERREDQLRYTVQNLQPLEKALSGKIREVHIHLESAKPLPALRAVLDTEGQGHIRILLFTEIAPGTTARMEIPGRWNFSAQARNNLMRAEGVG